MIQRSRSVSRRGFNKSYMRSVRLDLKNQCVTAGSDLHGTIILKGVGPIDHIKLDLLSGNNSILTSQLIENHAVGLGTCYIPFSIPVSVSVLPEQIQSMRGCVVCQVKATVKAKNNILSGLRIKSGLQASHPCTVENRGLPTMGFESLDSVSLTSSSLSRSLSQSESQPLEIPAPKKDETSCIVAESTSLVPTQREPDVSCFTALIRAIIPAKRTTHTEISAQPKQPLKLEQLRPPLKPLPKGLRWGYKTAFNVFVFPEFNPVLQQDETDVPEVNHHKHVLSI